MRKVGVNLFAGIAIFLASFCVSCAQAQQDKLSLKQVLDIPLTGNPSRLDYQSFDPKNGRLYIAHLGDSMMTVFDTKKNAVVGDVRDLKHVHGVLAVPGLHRVYASATGTNELAVIDDQTLQIIARVPVGNYPDGIAYAGKENKIYVSNKQGENDTVINAATNKVVTTIPLGGPVGNTQYDSVSGHIFAAVHKLNEIAEIDPATDKVVGRYPLTGCKDSHGLLIDSKNRLAFVACESSATLAVFNLSKKKQIATESVGADPDVLALDENLGRLYVSAESGILTIFDEKTGALENVAQIFFAKNAHTVAVDSGTHQVYFPLENVGGNPILRIVMPSDNNFSK